MGLRGDDARRSKNVHREQICSMLTSLGYEPPDIQPRGSRTKPAARAESRSSARTGEAMTSRITEICIDAREPQRVAEFWANVLGWTARVEDDEWLVVAPESESEGFVLLFV